MSTTKTRTQAQDTAWMSEAPRQAQPLARVEVEASVLDPMAVIEQRTKMLDRLVSHAVGATNAEHWCDLGGNPWLTGPGAESVARRCAVNVTETAIKKEWDEDTKGRYYLVTTRARFALPGGLDSIEAYGYCSSRDSFLGTETKAGRDVADVEEGSIRQASYTNCMVNGITRLLGIRRMSWERLAQLGLDRSKMSKVEYQSGAKGGASDRSFTFRFGKGKDKTPAEVSDGDLTWYAEAFRRDLADAEKSKYHAATKKQLAAVEAEQARRAAPKAAPAPAAAQAQAPSVWNRMEALRPEGMDEATFRALVKSATGKTKASEILEEDLTRVEAAIADRDASLDDDIPT